MSFGKSLYFFRNRLREAFCKSRWCYARRFTALHVLYICGSYLKNTCKGVFNLQPAAFIKWLSSQLFFNNFNDNCRMAIIVQSDSVLQNTCSWFMSLDGSVYPLSFYLQVSRSDTYICVIYLFIGYVCIFKLRYSYRIKKY